MSRFTFYTMNWWEFVAGVVVIAFGLSLTIMMLYGTIKSINRPPLTGINKARADFVQRCSYTDGAVPNVGSDNWRDWSCRRP